MNPATAPRSPRCTICTTIPKVHAAHLDVLLFGDDGRRRKPAEAIALLRSLGMAVPDQVVRKRIDSHVEHVQRSLARAPKAGAIVTTGTVSGTISRIAERPGWARIHDRAAEVGLDAIESLGAELPDLPARDRIAIAKTGLVAGRQTGEWTRRGHLRPQDDPDLMMAAGLVQTDAGRWVGGEEAERVWAARRAAKSKTVDENRAPAVTRRDAEREATAVLDAVTDDDDDD